MTVERDFDRIAAAWLMDGPTELPDRVIDAVADEIHLTRRRRPARLPWRFPTMTTPARLVALVAILALIAIGGLALGVGGSTPTPSGAPASAAAIEPTVLSTIGVPILDHAFTSNRNGYAISIPANADAVPATTSWVAGTKAPSWGDSALDQIIAGDVRFVGTQQKFAPGQTAEQWLRSHCEDNGGPDCASAPSAWEEIKISGATAYVDTNGIPAAAGTIAPDGKLFEALVTTPTRGWVFTMDGAVDRSVFDAYLKTVFLYPGKAVDTPPLTSTFTSPTYGYSVRTLPEWKTETATTPWTGVSNDNGGLDGVTITGTDTALTAASQPLRSTTFNDFLVAFHANQKAGVPNGCDGGEPSTWPDIAIGDQVGRLEMLCNAAEALVEKGGRVYLFEWGNETFEPPQHFAFDAWKEVLKTVTLTPETAK